MLITRYLFKNLLKITIFIAVTLTLVIWLTQSLKLLEFVANTAAPPSLFFKLIALTLPKFLEVILPISLAIAVLFSYNKLISDNELIIMRACGVNQYKLAKPAIILAIVVSIFITALSTWITPTSMSEMKSLRLSLKTKYSAFLLQEGVFNTFSNKFTVYISSRSDNGDLRGLMIYDTRNKNRPPVTILAKRGRIVMDGETPNIIVFDGIRQQLDKKTGALSKLYFSKYTIEIKGLNGGNIKHLRKENERTLKELFKPDMSKAYDRANKNSFIAEAHSRIISPWNVLAFTMISIVSILLGGFNRRGQHKKILIAVLGIIIVQTLTLTFKHLSKVNSFFIPLLYINSLLPIIFGFYLLHPSGEKRLNAIIDYIKKHISVKKINAEVK